MFSRCFRRASVKRQGGGKQQITHEIIEGCLLICCWLPLTCLSPHDDRLHPRGGYQVAIADLKKDGRPDIIALASGMDELVWFENPKWERHVIVRGQKRMINCAAWIRTAMGFPKSFWRPCSTICRRIRSAA